MLVVVGGGRNVWFVEWWRMGEYSLENKYFRYFKGLSKLNKITFYQLTSLSLSSSFISEVHFVFRICYLLYGDAENVIFWIFVSVKIGFRSGV